MGTRSKAQASRVRVGAGILAITVAWGWFSPLIAQNAEAIRSKTKDLLIVSVVPHQAEVLRAGSKTWDEASANTNYNVLHPGDQLRTGEHGRALLRLPEQQTILILDANSHLIIPVDTGARSAFELFL